MKQSSKAARPSVLSNRTVRVLMAKIRHVPKQSSAIDIASVSYTSGYAAIAGDFRDFDLLFNVPGVLRVTWHVLGRN